MHQQVDCVLVNGKSVEKMNTWYCASLKSPGRPDTIRTFSSTIPPLTYTAAINQSTANEKQLEIQHLLFCFLHPRSWSRSECLFTRDDEHRRIQNKDSLSYSNSDNPYTVRACFWVQPRSLVGMNLYEDSSNTSYNKSER